MARVSAEGGISEREAALERARSGIGFFAGPLLFLLVLLWPTPEAFWREAEAQMAAADAARLAFSMKVTLALLVLMVTWWVTEAVPLPVTALLPGIILPLFRVIGVRNGQSVELNGRAVLAHYANPVIFLFLSGFLIAGAMQKWGLDRRIALWILTRGRIAASPGKVVLSLMGASAFLSMWVSNTATTAMMLPIGLGILSRVERAGASSNYARALLLGIAYAASIGGGNSHRDAAQWHRRLHPAPATDRPPAFLGVDGLRPAVRIVDRSLGVDRLARGLPLRRHL